MSVCLWVCACERRCPWRPEGGTRSLDAGVKSSCELPDVGAENKLGSSARAMHTLNCRALSPALHSVF